MDDNDLKNRFTYRPPADSAKVEQYRTIRDAGYDLACLINKECPESREKSLAITKLEEVIMWTNAGIARHSNGVRALP